ncbi:hypothetical protein [Pseudomonas putida]|uniref:class III lanthionine synthetase LanKC N-terminal domain-containing protein n=1 Tax=Pseudomonas putida TaxID=303 RepID=UPI0015E743F1|nr:hypothetical protein [Pseudomonas putida]
MDMSHAEARWSELVNGMCGKCEKDDFWRLYSPEPLKLPTQGWKLHLSATPKNIHQIFRISVRIAQKYTLLIKFPRCISSLLLLNSGVGTALSQVGKVFTFYCDSECRMLKAAEELGKKTNRFRCPSVAFDEQVVWGQNLYFRYGVINGSSESKIVNPDGVTVADERGRGKAIPAWLQGSSFVRKIQGKSKSRHLATRLLPSDLLVFEALSQRAKGGVYKALDLSVIPGRVIILKEGRLDGEINTEGLDGYKLAKREGKNLKKLHRVGCNVPLVFRVIDLATHIYVATEYLEGMTLDYCCQAGIDHKLIICRNLMREISTINRAGWVWRDCKFSNIIVNGDSVRLIDMEGACRVEVADRSRWGSPGFIPDFDLVPRHLQDEYAGLLTCAQLIASDFSGVNSVKLSNGVKESKVDGVLKKDFANFLFAPSKSSIAKLLSTLFLSS